MNPKYATDLANAAAANSPSLANSPNGSNSHMQNLQNLAQLQMRATGAGLSTGAFGSEAGNIADIDAAKLKAAQAAEEGALKLRQVKEKIAEQKAADLADPKNYIKEVADDGGWNFYDPSGKPISVAQYSKATGKQITQALEGSNNPNDSNFTNDYKALLNYGKALAGDQDAINDFKKSKEGKAFLSKPSNKNIPYGEVVSAFTKSYGNYMQPLQTNNLTSRDAAGRNITLDAANMGGGNVLSNALGLYKKQNVTYR